MKPSRSSPVILHVEIGAQFLRTMLGFGVEGWNLWTYAMLERLPMSWSKDEPEPPARLCFEAQSADFSGLMLDGADLGLFDCERARFDSASAVGTMIGSCPHASFHDANLQDAIFVGDISGADFTGSQIGGMSIADASFNSDNPPLGLPDDLLKTCRAELPANDRPDDWPPVGVGLVKHPVPVKASLSASMNE